MKRFICMALVLMLVLFTVSCGSETNNPEQTGEQTTAESGEQTTETTGGKETEAGEQLEIPEGTSLSGKTFTIAVYVRDQNPIDCIFSEGENAATVNDAVYRRNMEIEKRTGAKLNSYATSAYKTLCSSLDKQVTSGQCEWDAVISAAASPYLASSALSRKLYDFRSLPYIDLEKTWWDERINDGFSIGEYQFLTSGDLLTINIDSTYILRYNQDLASTKGYQSNDFYNLVRNQKWTIDEMMKIAANFADDLNGDGQRTVEDAFGIAAVNTFVQALWFGCNQTITAKDDDNLPVFREYNADIQASYEKILTVFSNSDITINCNNNKISGKNHAQTADYLLTNRQALFQATILESMVRTNDAESQVGILPIPMRDENQESYCCVINPNTACCSALVVPSSCKNPEEVGILLETLMCYSQKYLRPAYFDVVFQYKVLDDEASYEMFNIILESRVAPDAGVLYGWGGMLAQIQSNVVANVDSIASVYATNAPIVRNLITQTLEKLK